MFTIRVGIGDTLRYDAQPYDGRERRRVVCRRAQNIGFEQFACSLRLSSTRSTADLQTEDVWDYVTYWFSGGHSIVNGDFNLRYDESSALPLWWYTHQEMHLPYYATYPTFGSEKIDYSFARRSYSGVNMREQCTSFFFSEHRYCYGNFTI